ncbi:MAG: DUF6412 domain-containing protein [Catenulispora sp.]
MLLWGFWALLALHSPTSSGSPAPFAAVGLGLAVLAAVLVVAVAAAGLPLPRPGALLGVVGARRLRTYRVPRLSDPNAAGRPRPRAPSALRAVI